MPIDDPEPTPATLGQRVVIYKVYVADVSRGGRLLTGHHLYEEGEAGPLGDVCEAGFGIFAHKPSLAARLKHEVRRGDYLRVTMEGIGFRSFELLEFEKLPHAPPPAWDRARGRKGGSHGRLLVIAILALLLALGASAAVLFGMHQRQQRLDQEMRTAITAGDEVAFERLVRLGASCRVVGPNGETCTALAAMKSSPELLREVLDKGAPVSSVVPGWDSDPLGLAVVWGQAENVKLLAERGADVNRSTFKGYTPVWYAVTAPNSANVLRALLEAKADPNRYPPGGRTALTRAALFSSAECVELLLQAGANPTLRDREGRTALDQARDREHELRLDALRDPQSRQQLADCRRIIAALSAPRPKR